MSLILSLSLLACSEYDLKRPEEDVEEPPVEEPEPEPTAPETAPDIELSPTSIDFGWVAQECTSEPAEVTITNVGEDTLVVDAIDLDGSGVAYFSLVRPQLPLELAPGESDVISVDFSPISSNALSAEVVVTSNDPDEGVVGVGLDGIGAEDPLFEETFYQDYYNSVDVLWVVDNSGSMSDAQNAIAENFENFIYAFTSLGLDYHMGVITTDMYDPRHQGKLQGDPAYLTGDTVGAEEKFLDMVLVGDSGSGSEQGFDAIQAALTEPLLSGANAGFLRGDDVALAVIVVTDENDDSSMSSSSFSSWFTGLKTDQELLSMSAFCGDRGTGCFSWVDWSTGAISATSGAKYLDVVDLTGGVFQSICSNDFSEALTHLSLNAVGMDYIFELTETPSAVADIYVEVDSVEAEYGSLDGWTYDSEMNAIVFHGDAIPEPAATIYVQYPMISECE